MLPTFRLFKNIVFLFSVLLVCACSSDPTDTPETDPNAPAENPDPGQPPVDTPNDGEPSLKEQLQAVVDDAVQSGIPGVSLFVQLEGENISVVSGVVNRGTEEPVTTDTLFQVASVGKIYTATLFMRFVDMNMLQLDDPISMLLDPAMSNMIADSDKITVEMLLAHTTGIQDYLNENLQFLNDFANAPGKVWTPTELLGYVSSDNYFEPGTEFRYSNTNFVLLGVIAERLTGLTFGAALRQWVFEPAGLENTYGAYEDLGQMNISHGYIPFSSIEGLDLGIDLPTGVPDIDTFAWLDSVGTADAPLHATPSDLNQFIRTLIDTDTLVSDRLKSKMLTESFQDSSNYGLGIVVAQDGTLFGHEGRLFGLNSSLIYFPSLDLSFGTVANAAYDAYDQLYVDYLTNLNSVFVAQLPDG